MDDTLIVNKIYNREEIGLNELKNKYDNLLYSLSYRILNSNEDSLECVNDTYLKIWKSIPPYKPNYLRSFICKINRQISIDKYRKNKKNYNNCNIDELDYEISSKDNIESNIITGEIISCINEYIKNLDIESKVIFVRKYFLLESSEDISKLLNISINSINVKSFRIRNKLIKHLKKEGFEIEKN